MLDRYGIQLTFMKILTRYLFFKLLTPLLYLLVVFSLLFIIGDLMDNLPDFIDSGTSFFDAVNYYGLRLPSMLIMIIPICLLLAVLYSLANLTRHSEVTAMRASGISIYSIVKPYILMGLICSLLTALVNEVAGPDFAYRADQFLKQEKARRGNKDTNLAFYEQIPYINPTANHIWFIKKFDTRSFTMHDITLRRRGPNGMDLEKISIEKARWMDGKWWFKNGTIQRYDTLGNLEGPPEHFTIREMRDLNEIPEDFMGEIKDADYQSSRELHSYIDTHQHLSHTTLNKLEVDFHHKISTPFVCIIIIMLGIPVGAHTGRKGAFAGILMALGLFFGFYLTQFTLEYLSKQMILAPWAGPWIPVGTFFIIGSFLIIRMR